MKPPVIPAVQAICRRRRLRGIAVEPDLDIVVVILLAPQHAGARLTGDLAEIGILNIAQLGRVELVRFALSKSHEVVEAGEGIDLASG